MTSNDPVPYDPDDTAGSLEMLTAALRQDAADLELYTRVLTGTLADALPPGSVTIQRKRGMADRLAGREGRIERLEVALGEQRLALVMDRGRVTSEVCKEVRGVVLSRRPAPLDEWVAELAAAVAARASSDARARAALERLILGNG
ncbi:hypothetical protein [Streptantibioticus silvisoli]|uniref:DUF222 domain-containing protein n=1 Tax=Streptantibioticus silvisoli TaxID=2705255 RepID=A0ABT6WB04_9ACTN|nr:hypothetical protein [Streptantibioticus silvisoli]MDI5967651.1 hypothetical protein [Streptantibioticus silvisoli]